GHYVDIVTEKKEDMAVVKKIKYWGTNSGVDFPKIFYRIFRGEKKRKRKVGGSGLGVAVTKKNLKLKK
ncbi:two-component sensor histidine kinase, partial [Clostridioides difficile]|nr:two-component sensor histidine kinase [Clostridioides difficile]